MIAAAVLYAVAHVARHGEPSPARNVSAVCKQDMPASVTDSLDSLDAVRMHSVMIDWCRGGVKNCAEIHAPTHVGMSRFRSRRRLWIPNLCSRVVLRERAPEGKRASMRQALLVKLRWSLVFRPCVCRERLPDDNMDGGGRRCFSANHGTRVPGRHGMRDPGFGPGLSA